MEVTKEMLEVLTKLHKENIAGIKERAVAELREKALELQDVAGRVEKAVWEVASSGAILVWTEEDLCLAQYLENAENVDCAMYFQIVDENLYSYAVKTYNTARAKALGMDALQRLNELDPGKWLASQLCTALYTKNPSWLKPEQVVEILKATVPLFM